ncbi:hypothetical protein [Mycolicibacterium chlorophenolicum]|uniref:Uncharacterized protein n=1 Tax=Mycolicibacterium chlorophenolicum TaxID=37916 RepID=A0A0J6ZCV2_9MYCO|nr:hypothetical protein [Mycolicibacterium chlorophenolicum]KMO82521.1 hypothetical protein MCHLDSM_01144 [Mycolicibacterium chlorophenolicum]
MATAVVIDIDGTITEHDRPRAAAILHARRTDHRKPLRANISDDGRTAYWAYPSRNEPFNAIATALWYQDCSAARAASWLAGEVIISGPVDGNGAPGPVPQDRLDALRALTRGL